MCFIGALGEFGSIARDFGNGFLFSLKPAVPLSEEAFLEYRKGECKQLDDTYDGCRMTVYTGGVYPKVLRLSRSIPTFDSGDRMYDSWHDLYLVKENNGHLHGVYAKGGYQIVDIYKIPAVLKFPEELKQYLET